MSHFYVANQCRITDEVRVEFFRKYSPEALQDRVKVGNYVESQKRDIA
ncbi:MAG: hypothetical protein R2688_02830 [Fimbriimonadaceae bacterium]